MASDDLLLEFPRRTIIAEYDEERVFRFLRWSWKKVKRVRRNYIVRTRSLRDLIQLETTFKYLNNELEARGGIDIVEMASIIVDRDCSKLPKRVIENIVDAHMELHYPVPKATTSPEVSPAPATPSSSESSSAGPSTSPEITS
jgi:hypothetical protein